MPRNTKIMLVNSESVIDSGQLIYIRNKVSDVSFASMASLSDSSAIIFIFNDVYASLDNLQHWKSELENAIQQGKNIYCLVNSNYQIKVPNKVKADIFGVPFDLPTEVSVYEYLFRSIHNFSLSKLNGESLKLSKSASKYLGDSAIENYNLLVGYSFYLNKHDGMIPLFLDADEKRVLGGVYLQENGSNVFFLPKFDTSDNKQLHAFVDAVLHTEEHLKYRNPEEKLPDWLDVVDYKTEGELSVIEDLKDIAAQVEELESQKLKKLEHLDDESKWKGLLYLNGTPLEYVVKEALELLEFEVSDYRKEAVEIDVIAQSDKGSFIGEVEGKDNKGVNVNKFRQLQDHLQYTYESEDFEEGIEKGVLFGNGHRLKSPDERDDCFTDACLKRAKGTSAALVSTVDLFFVVKYILENPNDKEFVIACREKILTSIGVVEFEIPSHSKLELVSNG